MAKVFVSYSHKDGDWVWTRLKPVLEAGGVEVLLDEEHFRPGGALHRQMDALQDRGERQLLVLNRASLASPACRHEQARAIALDPRFERHIVIPIRRDDADWPPELTGPNPLYVDLRDDDSNAREWDKLLRECGADLRAAAPEWLDARDRIVTALREGRSTNLIVSGTLEARPLVRHIQRCELPLPLLPTLVDVDLDSGATITRPALLESLLSAWGTTVDLPPKPNDLVVFTRTALRLAPASMAWLNFGVVAARRDEYDADLFRALRHLVNERRLTVLLESRRPIDQLTPPDPNSSPWVLETLELRGTP